MRPSVTWKYSSFKLGQIHLFRPICSAGHQGAMLHFCPTDLLLELTTWYNSFILLEGCTNAVIPWLSEMPWCAKFLCWSSCWHPLDMLISSIKSEVDICFPLRLPLGCLATKNGFNHHIFGWLVLTNKTFQSPQF